MRLPRVAPAVGPIRGQVRYNFGGAKQQDYLKQMMGRQWLRLAAFLLQCFGSLLSVGTGWAGAS